MKNAFLTIDDCPSSTFSLKLEYLIENAIPAVLFCIGDCLQKRPYMAVEAIKNGYIIGNHSFSHPAFSDISLSRGVEEITKTDVLIDALYKEANANREVKWFRFPYGDKSDGKKGHVFRWKLFPDRKRKMYFQDCLRELGYTQPAFEGIQYSFYHKANLLRDIDWNWTFDVMDWALHMNKPPFRMNSIEKILERIRQQHPKDYRGLPSVKRRWIGNTTSDEIILMHDYPNAEEIFMSVINELSLLPIRFKSPIILSN